ncbi:hypothetical protein WQ81_26540, partial [Escherichia coli]
DEEKSPISIEGFAQQESEKFREALLKTLSPAVADEFDNPTTDIRKDRCSKCMRGCEMRGMVANFGGFLSINKLSQ